MKHFAVILAFVAAAAQASVTNTVSNEASVKHWYRDTLTYDAAADTFSTNALSGVAESAALVTVAEAIPTLIEEATTALTNSLAPMQARLELEAQRPVVMLTGAAGLDNALDRENLTMAIVSNEWTIATNGNRHLDAYVFSNKILASPPVMQAALMTDLGTQTNWVDGVWDGYGSKACTVELTHQNAYTNFVIVSRDYGETKVIETNVTFTSINEGYEPIVADVHLKTVDYIKSNGNSYYLLDFTPNTKRLTRYEIDLEWVSVPQDGCVLGSRIGTNRYYVFYTYPTVWNIGWVNNYGASTKPIAGTRYKAICEMVSGSQKLTVDGSVFVNQSVASNFATTNLTLFAMNNSGVPSYMSNVKLYGLKIFENNVLSHDYVPCVYNDTYGTLYDTVDREYLYAQGATPYFDGNTIRESQIVIGSQTNFIPFCVTNTYTQALSLTNQVLITVDGQQPQIIKRGDKESFECYKLGFDLPPADQVRLNPWVKVGHPQNGFDFGNRQLRINGALAVTTNDVSEIGDWYTPDGNRVTLTPYLDQGLLRFADITDDSTED